MRLRDLTIWIVCMTLAVVLLIAAGTQLDYINAKRYEMKLISNEPLENAPPSLAFATVAMGAFRGLVADILWIRADKLKEQGQFFDAKQLAEWITVLQPRFAAVWEFQGWNMAYNISVCMPESQPEERWRWIRNGYELIRDKGLVVNPKSLQLYRELARIFQHKIGFVADNTHKYYKYQLLTSMKPLLGSADVETYDALANVPAEWDSILNDPNIAVFVEALKTADENFQSQQKFVSNYLALRQSPARFKPRAFEVIDEFRETKTLEKFDIFARAYQLRNVWKLDPALMRQLNNTYGPIDYEDPNKHLPLDWRHADSHAIYWATKGLQMANQQQYSTAKSNTDRIIAHSLQNLFRNGKIYVYDQPSEDVSKDDAWKTLFLRPDLKMFDSYNNAVLGIIEEYKELEKYAHGTYASFQIGHRNMLKNAVFSFYQAGHVDQALRIYKQLGQLYPLDEFKVPLVIYVRNRLRDELNSLDLHNVREMIGMLLREGYFRYAVHDDDQAYSREKMAKEIYDTYQGKQNEEGRIDLPDFKLLRYTALLDFFNDYQYPLSFRQNLLARLKLERSELAEQLFEQEKKLFEQAKD